MYHGDVATFSRQGQGSLGIRGQPRCPGASSVRSRRFLINPSALQDGSFAGSSTPRRRVRFGEMHCEREQSRATISGAAAQNVVPVLTGDGDGSGNGPPPPQKRVGDDGEGDCGPSSADAASIESILAKVVHVSYSVSYSMCETSRQCQGSCFAFPSLRLLLLS